MDLYSGQLLEMVGINTDWAHEFGITAVELRSRVETAVQDMLVKI